LRLLPIAPPASRAPHSVGHSSAAGLTEGASEVNRPPRAPSGSSQDHA
jgi:hypothetical protein